jgi:hypothetical protein
LLIVVFGLSYLSYVVAISCQYTVELYDKSQLTLERERWRELGMVEGKGLEENVRNFISWGGGEVDRERASNCYKVPRQFPLVLMVTIE